MARGCAWACWRSDAGPTSRAIAAAAAVGRIPARSSSSSRIAGRQARWRSRGARHRGGGGGALSHPGAEAHDKALVDHPESRREAGLPGGAMRILGPASSEHFRGRLRTSTPHCCRPSRGCIPSARRSSTEVGGGGRHRALRGRGHRHRPHRAPGSGAGAPGRHGGKPCPRAFSPRSTGSIRRRSGSSRRGRLPRRGTGGCESSRRVSDEPGETRAHQRARQGGRGGLRQGAGRAGGGDPLTGGTAALLRESGIKVVDVAEVTGFPRCSTDA